MRSPRSAGVAAPAHSRIELAGGILARPAVALAGAGTKGDVMGLVGRTLTIAAAVALVLVATGCEAIIGQAVKSGVEKATGVKVDEKTDSVTVTGKDGSSITSGSDIPAGFPEDVPVYDGTLDGALETKGPKGAGYNLIINTPDASADVFTFYETELAAQGWTVKTPVKTDGGGMVTAEKGATTVTVMISAGAEGQTTITQTVAPK